MRIGVAGFGRMGSAIAARRAATETDVLAWNRNVDSVRATGFAAAETPRALAAHCDIVLSSLFDESAVRAVYGGTDGLMSGGAGKLFIEMSTVRPETQTALALDIVRVGGSFLE
jgi:3-hydroxyisobutyrate dehydrogenase